MSHRQTSTHRAWTLRAHALCAWLVCAAILAVGGGVYAQAPRGTQPQPPAPVEPAPPQKEQEVKGSPKVSPDVVHTWQLTVSARLNQFKRYPEQARARRDEGKVIVAFTLDTEGHVVNSKIVKSSGSEILDQETLDLISRAQPYPAPPSGAGGQDLFLQVPISYAFH
jgi:periplasmic protein TonB